MMRVLSSLYEKPQLEVRFFENFPGAIVIKFLSVIYRFSYKARVFVRLDWKSFPMTNTLAYYENP
jgi:hypothetical protein